MIDEEIIEKFERENITLASYNSRVASYVIDDLIISTLFLVIYWQKISNIANVEEALLVVNTLTMQILLLKVIYHSFFVWMYGATPGKMFLKIRVISINLLDKPTLGISILRAVGRVFSESVLFLGYIWAFFDPKRQAWHDKIARTLVVNG